MRSPTLEPMGRALRLAKLWCCYAAIYDVTMLQWLASEPP